MPYIHRRKKCNPLVKKTPVFLVVFHSKAATFVRGVSRQPLHEGVDISAPRGTPITVYANISKRWEPLTVCATPMLTGYGNAAAFGYGEFTLFIAHLDRRPQIHDGIIYVGATGNATGYHAHIECILKDDIVNPFHYCTFKRR